MALCKDVRQDLVYSTPLVVRERSAVLRRCGICGQRTGFLFVFYVCYSGRGDPRVGSSRNARSNSLESLGCHSLVVGLKWM